MSDQKKLIFLDIDGVLNWAGTEDRISGFIGLCPERIARFNKIIDAHPDAKIVISSTWRKMTAFMEEYDSFDGLIALLHARGLRGDIIGHTPITFGGRGRGNEIREYLEDDYGNTWPTLVVLDDSTEAMEGEFRDVYGGRNDLGDDIWETVRVGDLQPFHVVSFWDGQERVRPDGYELVEEGGLQDHHIRQAIDVLNGKRLAI